MTACRRESCRAEFVPRVCGRPQAYCSPECRNLDSQARAKARDPVRYLARQAEYCRRYRASCKEMAKDAKGRRILGLD